MMLKIRKSTVTLRLGGERNKGKKNVKQEIDLQIYLYLQVSQNVLSPPAKK